MKKVVIIGAGPAGLTAAYELLRSGREYDVTILEESGEVGGISRTVCHGGNRMDIGGHRFFSKDPQVCKWWEDMMPDQGAPSYDDKLFGRQRPCGLYPASAAGRAAAQQQLSVLSPAAVPWAFCCRHVLLPGAERIYRP